MILWENYSEDELRSIVKKCYLTRNYEVIDLHESDRRGERGADLIVNKLGEAEKIAIALKIKPKKSDLYQLKELSERKERQKKYIHVKHPSTDFQFEKEKYDVDFWNAEKLTYEIATQSPSLAVWLVLSSHQFYLHLFKINSNLLLSLNKYFDEEEFGGADTPDQRFFRDIWRLKDCFSGLHKSFRSLQILLDSDTVKFLNTPEDNMDLLNTLQFLLSISVEQSNLNKMNRLIEDLIDNYGGIIKEVIEKTHDRSHWFNYLNFDYSLIPGMVRKDILENEYDLEIYRKLEKLMDKSSINSKIETYKHKECKIFTEIGEVTAFIGGYSDDVESFIDDLFSHALEKFHETNDR